MSFFMMVSAGTVLPRLVVVAANRTSYLRHAGGVLPALPVSPVIRLRTRLSPDACVTADVSSKDGTRVPTRQPRGSLAPGDPRGPPRRALRLSGTSRSRGLPFGTRVRRFGARSAFQRSRSPAAPHCRIATGAPYSPVETVFRNGIAAAPPTAIGRSKASWISAPNGLPSRRRSLPRQVLDPNAPSASDATS